MRRVPDILHSFAPATIPHCFRGCSVGDGPIFRNGFIDVPDKPGLGIELNPDVAKGASG
ncbi:MAG TPA: hypothetical protein VES20_24610 [Bryobacteraceae bacterium]|nr:hypothetical protein [Bryobacteraceae bacterium]